MTVAFNHTIVWASDADASAAFLAGTLGLPAPRRWGPFVVVTTTNGVNLDYRARKGKIAPQHYAFLLGEAEFDAALARIRDRGQTFWADPGQTRPGEVNGHDGGRGLYFEDPDGHLLEIITRAYGSGGWNP